MDTLMSSRESSKPNGHPPPADFDTYLPWACFQLSVAANIIINRSILKEYVSKSNAATDRIKLKRKKSRPPSLTSESFEKTQSDFAWSVKDEEKTIYIQTIYDSDLKLIRIKFLNNTAIPRQIMKIIGLMIPFHKHLTSITINSGLHKEAMYEISKILPISRITEICLDGTFFVEANYHVLLDQNCLKHLSLARCKINDTVLKTITSKLVYPCPASKSLSVLNLSTNRITDTGAKYLAEMLRSNRQLSYLNLADNRITDVGASSIYESLVKFPLTSTELADLKTRQAKYLGNLNILVSTIVKSFRNGNIIETKPHKKKINKPVATLVHKRKTVDKDRSLDSIKSPVNMDELIFETAKTMAENKIGPFSDPFSPENIEKRNEGTYCYGNNILCYLNLAYNNLTYISIKKLYEVLVTQKVRVRTPKGLINVIIEGNFLPVSCGELEEIDALLGSGLDAYNAVSDSLKRRASRSRSNTK